MGKGKLIELTMTYEYGALAGRWSEALGSRIKEAMKIKGYTLATGVFEYFVLVGVVALPHQTLLEVHQL